MKKAIVIGASSGIGRGLALELSKEGYKVGISARREGNLRELATQHPDKFIVSAFDITEIAELEVRLNNLVNLLGGLDLIVIAAGLTQGNKELDMKTEKYVIDCNVVAFSIIVNWAYNYFSKQGAGHIVGLSSVAGTRGWHTCPKYNAGKAYQMNYLEGIHIKSKKEKANVAVTDIRPGYVDTDIMGDEYTFWVKQVDDVVPSMMRAIKRKKRVAYVPYRWKFAAMLYRIIPIRMLERG